MLVLFAGSLHPNTLCPSGTPSVERVGLAVGQGPLCTKVADKPFSPEAAGDAARRFPALTSVAESARVALIIQVQLKTVVVCLSVRCLFATRLAPWTLNGPWSS